MSDIEMVSYGSPGECVFWHQKDFTLEEWVFWKARINEYIEYRIKQVQEQTNHKEETEGKKQ